MTRYLLDTNIISNVLRPEPSAALMTWLGAQADDQLFVAFLTIAEIKRGISEKPKGRKRDALDAWFDGPEGPHALFAGRIQPFDEQAALRWTGLMADGKKRSRPRSPLDMIIAAFADANGCIVVTTNERHFAGIEVLNPLQAGKSWRRTSLCSRSIGRGAAAATTELSYHGGNQIHLREATLTKDTFDRRDVVKLMAAAGAAGTPAASALWPAAAHAATPAYDPAGKFEVDVREVEFRRNSAGRMLMARIYQPKGPGPFPTVLDLHGGAWNNKDRHAEQPMDRALAASGLLVVAVDMTVAHEAPYPACVQDANYAVRWLKQNAATWNGDTAKIGVYGSSSGGHVAELLGLRPHDPRYNAIPLAGASNVDATVAWVACRSPISDTFARYQNAESHHRENMMKNNKTFFNPWETIHESNPREIIERDEKVTLVPLLIMQGALDDNVLPAAQENFVKVYKAAGGNVEYHLFENSVHEWVAEPGPQTDKARETVKAFVARQLKG